jgi:hypothetical protein
VQNDFQDLSGSEFERANMSGSRFTTVLLNGATIRHSDMHQVTMRGVEIVDTTIDGEIHNLVINGVDVAPLIEAELDKRYPDGPNSGPPRPPDSARRGTSTSGCGRPRWSALASSTPSSCTSR